MTDDELNEIFRAIRHRRTLSWATIENLANEVRASRATKTTLVKADPGALAARNQAMVNIVKVADAWNNSLLDFSVGGKSINTTMVPPKPGADLAPKAKEYLDRISASIQRKYEDKMLDAVVYGQSAMTCNVDPDKPTMGGTRLMKSVEEFDWDTLIYQKDVRPRNIFNSVMPTPIADSQKKG